MFYRKFLKFAFAEKFAKVPQSQSPCTIPTKFIIFTKYLEHELYFIETKLFF